MNNVRPLLLAAGLALIVGLPAILSAQGIGEAKSDATVQLARNAKFGPILTDSSGRSLYVFEKDGPDLSSCYGGCAAAWPPLTVGDEKAPTAGPGVTGKLGTVERTDGSYQVTYNGMPLYTFVKDERAGDTAGQDVGPEGGKWYLVPPRSASFEDADMLLEKAEESQQSSGGGMGGGSGHGGGY